ncbi:MAG: hypothetical protein GY815_04180 [Gammaproteobacteria bacterium]|nr:hypothetical protein [Gammaproteobacteria bacterium]
MATISEDRSRASGSRTRSESTSWLTLVADAEGRNYPFFEHKAYEFSRKTFHEDDNAGNYNKPFPSEV